ncbi:helix-turn-helix domain-containing protein [Ruminococcaceae bacterium OttesenSCG-928-L11]|nr:helix-turn-helix domain-containing protein [Ruminococcaceae bacterium OttesenSCG-928-L11]
MNNKIRMLTINEAAALIPGLTRFRIRTMCQSGEIPCIKAGRKYLICEQVLLDKLTQRAVPPPADNSPIRRIDA